MARAVKIVALGFLLSALSSNVQAACVPSDIAGAWRVFAVTGSASFQGFGRGTVVFSNTGVLILRFSVILDSDGTLTRFRAGRARIARTCRATGSLVTNLGGSITVVDGQLDRTKSIISGVYRDSNGDVGLVNFIRI